MQSIFFRRIEVKFDTGIAPEIHIAVLIRGRNFNILFAGFIHFEAGGKNAASQMHLTHRTRRDLRIVAVRGNKTPHFLIAPQTVIELNSGSGFA